MVKIETDDIKKVVEEYYNIIHNYSQEELSNYITNEIPELIICSNRNGEYMGADLTLVVGEIEVSLSTVSLQIQGVWDGVQYIKNLSPEIQSAVDEVILGIIDSTNQDFLDSNAE